MTQGDILIIKRDDSLAERFYTALLTKSTLPLHSSWQNKLLELAQQTKILTPITAHGVRAYDLSGDLSAFETQVRRALVSGELPKIAQTPCV